MSINRRSQKLLNFVLQNENEKKISNLNDERIFVSLLLSILLNIVQYK